MRHCLPQDMPSPHMEFCLGLLTHEHCSTCPVDIRGQHLAIGFLTPVRKAMKRPFLALPAALPCGDLGMALGVPGGKPRGLSMLLTLA